MRPHAVAAITGSINGVTNPSYSYDANGNLTSGAGRSFTWTSFDLPSRISRGAANLDFNYGPEHQRLRQISPTATTIYLSAPHYEKETQSTGLVLHKHYLHAGGQLVGLYTQRSNGQHDTRYFASHEIPSHWLNQIESFRFYKQLLIQTESLGWRLRHLTVPRLSLTRSASARAVMSSGPPAA